MKIINQQVLNNIAVLGASYIALGTRSKQTAWTLLKQAGFIALPEGKGIRHINTSKEYKPVKTRSGEIAFKSIEWE